MPIYFKIIFNELKKKKSSHTITNTFLGLFSLDFLFK